MGFMGLMGPMGNMGRMGFGENNGFKRFGVVAIKLGVCVIVF